MWLVRVLRGVIPIISFCIILSSIHVVSADGGFVPFKDFDVEEPGQRAIIAWNGSREMMILSVDAIAEGQTSVVHIVPFPEMPHVSRGNASSFQRLEETLNWDPYGGYYGGNDGQSGGQGGGNGSGYTPYQLTSSRTIIPLHAESSEDVLAWVDGYILDNQGDEETHPDRFMEIIESYISKGIQDFIIDIVDLSENITTVEPIVYEFNTTSLFFPLEISSMIKGSSLIQLALIVDDTVPYDITSMTGSPLERTMNMVIDHDDVTYIEEGLSNYTRPGRVRLMLYEGDVDLPEVDYDIIIEEYPKALKVDGSIQFDDEFDWDGDGVRELVVLRTLGLTLLDPLTRTRELNIPPEVGPLSGIWNVDGHFIYLERGGDLIVFNISSGMVQTTIDTSHFPGSSTDIRFKLSPDIDGDGTRDVIVYSTVIRYVDLGDWDYEDERPVQIISPVTGAILFEDDIHIEWEYNDHTLLSVLDDHLYWVIKRDWYGYHRFIIGVNVHTGDRLEFFEIPDGAYGYRTVSTGNVSGILYSTRGYDYDHAKLHFFDSRNRTISFLGTYYVSDDDQSYSVEDHTGHGPSDVVMIEKNGERHDLTIIPLINISKRVSYSLGPNDPGLSDYWYGPEFSWRTIPDHDGSGTRILVSRSFSDYGWDSIIYTGSLTLLDPDDGPVWSVNSTDPYMLFIASGFIGRLNDRFLSSTNDGLVVIDATNGELSRYIDMPDIPTSIDQGQGGMDHLILSYGGIDEYGYYHHDGQYEMKHELMDIGRIMGLSNDIYLEMLSEDDDTVEISWFPWMEEGEYWLLKDGHVLIPMDGTGYSMQRPDEGTHFFRLIHNEGGIVSTSNLISISGSPETYPESIHLHPDGGPVIEYYYSLDSDSMVRWNPDPAIQYYHVYLDGEFSMNTTGSSYGIGPDELFPGIHTIQVSGHNEFASTISNPVDILVTAEAALHSLSYDWYYQPTTPLWVDDDIHEFDGAISLKWECIRYGVGYRVHVDGELLGTTRGCSIIIRGVDPGIHSVTLVSDTRHSSSPPSQPRWIEVIDPDTSRMNSPRFTTLNGSIPQGGSFLVRWTPIHDASGYTLRSGGDIIYQGESTSFNLSTDITGTHRLTVQAFSEDKYSPKSPAMELLVGDSQSLSRPSIRSVSVDIMNDALHIEWTEVIGATSYSLNAGETSVYNGSSLDYLLTVSQLVELSHPPLEFTVIARNGMVSSDPSLTYVWGDDLMEEMDNDYGNVPGRAEFKNELQSTSNGTFRLEWVAPGADHVVIVENWGRRFHHFNDPTTWIDFTGLPSGYYLFEIHAWNVNGSASGWSEVRMTVTNPDPPLRGLYTPMVYASPTSGSVDTITLGWMPVPHATGYEFTTGDATIDLGITTYHQYQVEPGIHSFSVTAYNDTLRSGDSGPLSYTFVGPLPRESRIDEILSATQVQFPSLPKSVNIQDRFPGLIGFDAEAMVNVTEWNEWNITILNWTTWSQWNETVLNWTTWSQWNETVLNWTTWNQWNETVLNWTTWSQWNETILNWTTWSQWNETILNWTTWSQWNETILNWTTWSQWNETILNWTTWNQWNETILNWTTWNQWNETNGDDNGMDRDHGGPEEDESDDSVPYLSPATILFFLVTVSGLRRKGRKRQLSRGYNPGWDQGSNGD